MVVDHALAKRYLDEVDGVVPAFPKVTVHLGEPDEDGLAEFTIEGSAHAEPEDVARALNLPVDVTRIRRHTPSTVGYVVTEGRPPSAGALTDRGVRGRIKRTPAPRPVAQPEPDVIESKPATRPKKRSSASTAGRRK